MVLLPYGESTCMHASKESSPHAEIINIISTMHVCCYETMKYEELHHWLRRSSNMLLSAAFARGSLLKSAKIQRKITRQALENLKRS